MVACRLTHVHLRRVERIALGYIASVAVLYANQHMPVNHSPLNDVKRLKNTSQNVPWNPMDRRTFNCWF